MARPPRVMGLTAATLSFLVLPLLFFLLGWLRWPLGLPLALLLAGGAFALCFRSPDPAVSPGGGEKESRVWPWVLAAALVWVILSGAGPFGHQTNDWKKHNAVLKDLIVKPWPVYYAEAPSPPGPGRAALVYYLGYYLPAAGWGKLFGWPAAYWFLFVWTTGGVALSLAWFLRLVGSSRRRLILIFVFASGLDALGALVVHHGFSGWPFLGGWAGVWRYPDNTDLLLWVPQHALGGWLSTAVVIDRGIRGQLPRWAGLIIVSCFFWSPFASLGLLPFVLYWCAPHPRALLAGWSNYAICPLVGLVLASFYASLAQAPPHEFLGWEFLVRLWRRYVLFWTLEAGLYVALCTMILRRQRESLPILWVAGVSLLFIPVYRAGLYNDWAMRVSIPGLFVLWVFLARALMASPAPRLRTVLWLVFLIGAITPTLEIAHSIAHFRVGIPRLEGIGEVPGVQGVRIGQQYVADRDSFFFRVLARPER